MGEREESCGSISAFYSIRRSDECLEELMPYLRRRKNQKRIQRQVALILITFQCDPRALFLVVPRAVWWNKLKEMIEGEWLEDRQEMFWEKCFIF